MTATAHPMQERYPLRGAIVLALTVSLVCAGILGFVYLELFPPEGWYDDHSFPASVSWFVPYAVEQVQNAWTNTSGIPLSEWFGSFSNAVWYEAVLQFDLASAYEPRLLAIAVVSVASGIVAAFLFLKGSIPRDSLIHISGRRSWRGYEALREVRKILKPDIRNVGRGLFIAPSVATDRSREVQHMGLVGTTGSGKSTILRFLAEQALARGDKILLHDTKGDILAGFPTDSFVLLAPHDQRGLAWDVARDVVTDQDARELSARLVPESSDPMWSGAARDIHTGIIVTLQRTKLLTWSWQDLADAAFLPMAELLTLLRDHYPTAARYIELDAATGAPTRTTHGILITLWANVVGIVMPLAKAWGHAPPERRISIAAWITDDTGALPKTLVLQRSPRHPTLSTAWIGAVVESLANVAAGPDLPESASRRVFLFLDEFAQLGRMTGFRQLLEVGRSKGLACVLALQDIQQLIGLYGDADAKTILTLLGLKIVGKLPTGPSAVFVADEFIGRREVVWQEQVRSTSRAMGAGQSVTVNHSTQSHTATISVVTPHYLESRLGVDRNGVTALLLGLGDVFELRWPLNAWPIRRAATQPAEWTQG